MNKMCHAHESEDATMDGVDDNFICSTSCYKMCGNGEKSSIIDGDMGWLSMEISPCSTPYGTPPFSRESSCSSFASCFSSLDEYLVETDYDEEIELLDTGQLHPGILFFDESIEQRKGGPIQVEECQPSHAASVDDGSSFSIPTNQNISSGELQLEIHIESTDDNSAPSNVILDANLSTDPHQAIMSIDELTETFCGVPLEDINLKQSNIVNVEEGTSLPMANDEINEQVMDQIDNAKENSIVYNNITSAEQNMNLGLESSDYLYPQVTPSFDTDPHIWLPPEPVNKEDDTYIVANNDDDSDNNDSWVRSNFNISFDAHQNKNSRENQLQRAMSEVMNGQFKILVSRFLAAEGLSSSDREGEKNWLDIVASLSWQAALHVKPDANIGNEMDPCMYVKVKCIASGSWEQSEVIKGLVFKKCAAQKQMRADIKHPKLLLLQGILGHSSAGLLSMDSMKQENEHLEKTLDDVISKCRPDLILVEKAVSRNVNEFIHKKGVTVVSDMNIHRLERIARCTSSPILLLQNVLAKPDLMKQCESAHFEKFIEEHNITGEGGKRSAKTLLFLEGFPKPLGCTILLKGSTSEELKKVKRVLHFTVFAAYHLILETSFFADQRLFAMGKNATENDNCVKTDPQLLVPCTVAPQSKFCSDIAQNDDTKKHALNILASDGEYVNQDKFVNSEKSMCIHDSRMETSRGHADTRLNDNDNILSYSSLPVQGLSRNLIGEISPDFPKLTSCNDFVCSTSGATSNDVILQKNGVDGKNCLETVSDGTSPKTKTSLDSQSILISMSSQHIRNKAICEQNHLSRITYYGYFDTSLGRYLQDSLFNEKHCCLSCGEPPEAHMYSYTHHNGTLTVLVKSLPLDGTLSGEHQGRIWMWTRCLRCNGKPSQRFIISSSARNLSFGKFLELSFSTHSAAKKLSTCGHLLHRDCLRFFGMGTKVAMFRYFSVEIYSAFKPPLTLEFYNPNRKECLGVEFNNVLLKWRLLISEAENKVQILKSGDSQAAGERTKISVHEELLLEVTRMLTQEKNEFEVYLKAFDHLVKSGTCVHEILGLNWLYQLLLLGCYIWDVRLQHILQYSKVNAASSDSPIQKRTPEDEPKNSEITSVHGEALYRTNLEMERQEESTDTCHSFDSSCGYIISEKEQLTERPVIQEPGSHVSPDHDVWLSLSSSGEDGGSHEHTENFCLEKPIGLPVKNNVLPETANGNGMYSVAMSSKCFAVFPNLLDFFSNDARKWVWGSFSHLENEYKKELQGGSLDKFYLINKYTPSFSSLAHLKSQLDMVQFIVGPGGSTLSIVEEEVSSMIAYALSISEQKGTYSEAVIVKDKVIASRNFDKVAPSNLIGDTTMSSLILSPNESLEKDHSLSRNVSSLSSEESTSGFYDSFLSALKDLHPEICLNNETLALKSKYSVVCIYAKQFHDLRKVCCPSEIAYIASISRCKEWNAQGGKSKAFFAKSMDDRFVIKQIKKTEFDSFLKFGLEYFKHFGVSQASVNTTCLAKILGIYQVKEIKNGKETRTNFMVMENLLFGRDIVRRYDLKGALFSRYVLDSKNPEKVLLDQNFIEDMRTMPIYIEGKTKNLMERAIWNDTAFLSRMNVMDYSLLVGVDKQKKELVFGIIDYLRQYTWDKQLESWVKTSLVVPKNLSPTVISPKEYKIRFRAFMSQYFLTVPDV
ncbi:putative 1-phosphatidylinositol-3-phosphate 5-kinase FAB1D [Oryza brachyantha]|uniref:1-phosphatidylinositol-3-phosphate 5-kinase n=1 Tax=Oryza brachyantha TaxID=4533 RepID=J3MW34_ORYBR|nr:putative 1-phosphatidylinositol-3-phosphate 5-kinase FAB1D [Oryza brachyantha]XP_015696707.1 putative 1-phosphatidylinositol-3-phosphate 5-kinase FAB1D [Oryza brachyantha]